MAWVLRLGPPTPRWSLRFLRSSTEYCSCLVVHDTVRQVLFSNLQKHKIERKISSIYGYWKGILLQCVGELSVLESPRDVKLKVHLIRKSVLTFQSHMLGFWDNEVQWYTSRTFPLQTLGSTTAEISFLQKVLSPLLFYVKISVCLSAWNSSALCKVI